MKAIFIVAIVLGAVLISAAAITVAILMMDESSNEADMLVPPTAPVFNSGDNAECQSIITEYYEYALLGYNSEITGKAKLDAAWQGVLTAQSETGVNIVNN